MPAFVSELGARAGGIDYDMAFGGNFYAIAAAASAGLTVAPDRAGELALGQAFVHESIIGTRFTGRLVAERTVGDRPAVVPEITGRASITGRAEYVLDATDPFPEGFVVA